MTKRTGTKFRFVRAAKGGPKGARGQTKLARIGARNPGAAKGPGTRRHPH